MGYDDPDHLTEFVFQAGIDDYRELGWVSGSSVALINEDRAVRMMIGPDD